MHNASLFNEFTGSKASTPKGARDEFFSHSPFNQIKDGNTASKPTQKTNYNKRIEEDED